MKKSHTKKGGSRYFSSKYNKKLVEANIRKAFCDKTDFNTTEELIPEEANLLNIANFTSEIYADNLDDYYPRQNVVENIMDDDKGKLKVDKKTQQLIDLAIETGNDRIVLELQQRVSSHPNKNRSFHYLPYRTDSGFEQTFLREVLSFDIIEKLGLEVYYNGDRAMTEFKIKCYKKTSGKWNYIGIYTPDFLIIKRKDGVIHKVIVVETKGQIYAKDPVFKDKKNFMETEFSKQNNAAYGYERFDYLYLEDTMPEKDRLTQTHQKICEFFKGERIMSDTKNSVLPDIIEPMSNAIQQNIPETARQADGALSTVVGFFNNVVLYPVKKANLTFRYKLEAFEDDLKEKIKNIPEENLQVPPVKIAGPVLEALRYAYDEAELREMYEETGLKFTPLKVDPAFEKPYFTTVGMTDESCATVYGYAEGEISKDAQEDTEEIEVVLADREEVKRISA